MRKTSRVATDPSVRCWHRLLVLWWTRTLLQRDIFNRRRSFIFPVPRLFHCICLFIGRYLEFQSDDMYDPNDVSQRRAFRVTHESSAPTLQPKNRLRYVNGSQFFARAILFLPNGRNGTHVQAEAGENSFCSIVEFYKGSGTAVANRWSTRKFWCTAKMFGHFFHISLTIKRNAFLHSKIVASW